MTVGGMGFIPERLLIIIIIIIIVIIIAPQGCTKGYDI